MQIITVAPVVRGALQGTLTYFSKDPIPAGMAVVVPIRTREVPAIVLESREASSSKSSLKSSEYSIRKIARAKPRRIWLPNFLKAVEKTADFSAQKFSETLLALTPKAVLDAHLEGTLAEPNIPQEGEAFKMCAMQESMRARHDAYQRLVRESFVRHESVFVCVPTEDDVLRIAKVLGHGIEDYTFSFHSSLTKKQVLLRWQNALGSDHAILAIGTTQYLGLPRFFKTIILDEEHSHSWKTLARPHIDLRVFVEEYARTSKSTLILGSAILRAETHERVKEGAISEFERIAYRAREETKTSLIDPRREEKFIKENTGKRELILITKELRELIEEARANKKQTLLLSARKGLSPVTTCGDCGTLVKCPECDTPLVVHQKASTGGSAHIYVCHGCGLTRVPEDNVHETCPQCGGWRLQGVGIGIDRIDNEIAALFPDSPRFVLDGDRAKTRTQAKKIIDQFQKTSGAILVATPMALPLLDTVDNTAIVSIDSLFAIPDIRISERIFALILAAREKTTGMFLAQTRADDTSIFEQALSGKLLEFTENELAIRKTFSYPPYGTIIKITLRGKRSEVSAEMERLKIFLEKHSPIIPGTIAREPKNIFRMHMILKLEKNSWPQKELLEKLRTLPMQFTIEVNPDNLL